MELNHDENSWVLSLEIGGERVMLLSSNGDRNMKPGINVALACQVISAAQEFSNAYRGLALATNDVFIERSAVFEWPAKKTVTDQTIE